MSDTDASYRLLPVAELPAQPGWLSSQPVPVIAVGDAPAANADVLVPDARAAIPLVTAIERHPLAAQTLVQVLRAVESLPLNDALTLESIAYGLLQSGPEHQRWLAARATPPAVVESGDGPAVLLARDESVLRAELNRPQMRNSLTIALRDALAEAFELVALDDSIERLELSGRGACFCVGGELREFGLAPDPVTAHAVRTRRLPGRLLAAIASRVHCRVHGACIGAGVELPAFAARVSAAHRTFFQLPELAMGLIPGAGGCVSITRRIGRQRTAWLALSGRRINAATALAWGLVDTLCD